MNIRVNGDLNPDLGVCYALEVHSIWFSILTTEHALEFVSHFVECDTVTVSPNQIIIIIIIIP